MGIVSELFNVEERAVSIQDVDNFLDYLLAGGRSSTGIAVNETEAMKHAAVFSCVKVLSEDVASLPLIVYKKIDDRTRERAPYHWLYKLLHDRPNPEMDAMVYIELIMANLLLWGNHYSFKDVDQLDRIKGLWPLMPNKMEIYREDNGSLTYIYCRGEKNERAFDSKYIWHVRGLGTNGILGYSVIKQMAESIGFGVAVEKFGGTFFKNAGVLSGALTHPGKMRDKKVADRMIKSFRSAYTGEGNWHGIVLLEEGMDWKQMGVPPDDAQFLESRKFSKREIAGWYRVKPHKIGDLERATFNNIEEENIDYVNGTLRPWFVRIERSARVNLLGERERLNYYPEFLIDALLRGNAEARHRVYAAGRQWGYFSANDVRRMENMNPVDGGDVYFMPMNMLPATDEPMPPKLPAPPEEDDEEPEEVKTLRIEWRGMVKKRSVSNRKRIRQNFLELFGASAKRVVSKETLAIKKALTKIGGKRGIEDFRRWLDDFYNKLPNDIEEIMMPVMASYAAAVQEVAAHEVGAEVGMTEALEEFMRKYTENMGKRYIGSSVGQINKIMEEIDIKELEGALIQRMDEWMEREPEKIARRETVEAGGAVAKFVYAGAGVTTLVWVANSGACPFCAELDGMVVGIEKNFVESNTDIEAGGTEAPMKIYEPKSHPPLHEGCECDIVAG